MHGAIGVLAVIGLIAFAFGETAARTVVASGLILAGLTFAYVMFRVVTGTI